MATVETVRGPVAAERLGRTLAHDHVFILGQETLANFNHRWGEPWWDEEKGVAEAVRRLQRVRDAGFETIVDPTAVGLGRDIGRIKRINQKVDLNIVVCTGVYSFMELPQFLRYRTVEALAELFVHELTEGIGDTGVKAAFIKVAVEEHGLVGDVPRILAAVGAAHAETGAPVMVHTNAAAQSGLVAAEALTAAGVDPAKLVIAHVGDSNDLDYIRRLAGSGAYLGWDRFNIEHFNPDADRIETVTKVLAEGYVDQLHFSHDGATFHDFMVGDPAFAGEHADYLHITNVILPQLRERGVSDADIDRVMVDNPRRWLA
ncbi:MAG: phosphotriesterase [Verrucomicrobiota bacterium]